MKRKTNLFYLTGEDSKFITFSNYGESLTGNFLATDWKLFPSKFICIYCKYLDVDDDVEYNKRKENFIQYIASYYENKMTFLREYCVKNNLNVEQTLKPLNYLLEALYRLPADYSGMVYGENGDILPYNNIEGNNFERCAISFIGDITEQDYNGTYTDIINLINSSDYPCGDIILDKEAQDNKINYSVLVNNDIDAQYLYGWTEGTNENNIKYNGPLKYGKALPIFDEPAELPLYGDYCTTSIITGLKTDRREQGENIKFNLLIPLYDLININSSTNTTNIVSEEFIDEENNIKGIDLSKSSSSYIKNVPMGIWFSGKEIIELKRNSITGYAPSWSLLLSSQFKPFPYSQKIPGEISQNNTKEAYATYSQILIRQNRLLDKLDELSKEIIKINRRIDVFESKLNNTGTSYTMDALHTEMIKYENHLNNNIQSFKDEIYSYVTNNWKGYIG